MAPTINPLTYRPLCSQLISGIDPNTIPAMIYENIGILLPRLEPRGRGSGTSNRGPDRP